MRRVNDRAFDAIRPLKIIKDYTRHAEGSILIESGDTRVLCNASVQENYVPRFLKGSGQGWITAEYGMLPRATNKRVDREAARSKQTGRTIEIQRLIGRSLRAMVDLQQMGEHSIMIDCDVLQADGGTRTAAITGGCVALVLALNQMKKRRLFKSYPLKTLVAAVSVGIFDDDLLLDLNYQEDSNAETDMNFVLTDKGGLIEVQGTAEKKPFTEDQLMTMLVLARQGAEQLFKKQKEVLDI